ncbi:MAG: hypothetical protein WAW75_11665 [Gallionella sp.]
MDNHLNFFVPYEKAAAWHENQLTRALLVVLRYSPMAHQAWLRLVAPEQHLHELSKAEFATQRQRVLGTDSEVPEGEAVHGISVWLAPDAALVSTPIEPSDRQQVLDGIVTYGNDLVVVIENKVAWGGVTEQPHQINLHGSPVVFEEKPRSVTWQQLLGALSDLVERDLVSGAERLLISDFFDLVEKYFPRIGPYSTLARCGDQRFRVERRLHTIQGEVVGTDTGKALGWRDLAGTPMIAMAWLGIANDNSAVCLRMYPADTLGQSRAFYGDPSAVDEVLALQSDGWRVEPNFHWGFTASGYAWSKTSLTVEKYCAYWVNEISATRELRRPEWETYWAKLQSDHIVEAVGKEAFDAEFTRSQRQKAHPRPGLFCEYAWPLAEAQQLDAHGKLVEKVRTRLNQMLTALHAPPVTAPNGAP